MDSNHVLEDLMSQMGEYGLYQFRQHVLHILGGFLAGMHMLSLTMVAPTPDHRCFIEDVDTINASSPSFNVSVLSKYIPLTNDDVLKSCSKFINGSNHTESCGNNFTFDNRYYHSSKVIDLWDFSEDAKFGTLRGRKIICEEKWKRTFMQSVYMFGVLTGAIVVGAMADKYGRKPLFYLSAVLQLIAGLGGAFIPSFYPYVATLFIYGMFGSGGAYVTGFVLTMELVGKSKRTICGTITCALSFACGVMAVACWACVIKEHQVLQMIFALHSLLLVGNWWLIDESVRWLWSQNRCDDAVKIVEKAVKCNGKEFENRYGAWIIGKGDAIPHASNSNATEEKAYGFLDLFKTPRLCFRSLNVFLCWFANSLVFYGLSLNTGNLTKNPNLMVFLIGAIEFPSFLTIVLFERVGRRAICTGFMMIGSAACIAASFIAKGELLGAILVIVGKYGISGSFAIIYTYTAELFPTVVRNSAIGMGSMGARFSAALTPWLSLLDSEAGNMQIPFIIFGGLCIISAFLVLFLPETLNKGTLETIQDGENFGRGDTGYKPCFRMCRRTKRIQISVKPNKLGR